MFLSYLVSRLDSLTFTVTTKVTVTIYSPCRFRPLRLYSHFVLLLVDWLRLWYAWQLSSFSSSNWTFNGCRSRYRYRYRYRYSQQHIVQGSASERQGIHGDSCQRLVYLRRPVISEVNKIVGQIVVLSYTVIVCNVDHYIDTSNWGNQAGVMMVCISIAKSKDTKSVWDSTVELVYSGFEYNQIIWNLLSLFFNYIK